MPQTTAPHVNRIGDGVQGVTVAEFLHAKGGPMAESSIKLNKNTSYVVKWGFQPGSRSISLVNGSNQ